MSILNRSELEQLEAALAARGTGVIQMSNRVLSLTASPTTKGLYTAEKYAKQLLREVQAMRRLESSLAGVKARLEAAEQARQDKLEAERTVVLP